MARYQILYWEHIPIGVKATDTSGTVRENLPARFQEVFEKAVTQNRKHGSPTYTTSGFRWSEERVRGGTAADVVTDIIRALDKTWDETKALALFEKQKSSSSSQFLDLKKL